MRESEEGKQPASERDALAATELGAPSVPPASGNDEPDALIGRVIGGLYRIERRIGEGGMGTVYAAQHVHLRKRFAVKVLSRRIAADRVAVERLRQEAVAASSIDHDNIVDVVSFDTTEDGDVFIVMELLKGASLAALVADGVRRDATRAVHIAIQISRALYAAHQLGIVHRDLKPENVFIVRKGDHDFVKVLDFGISKIKSAEADKVRVTKTGQLIGTPLYMSPEQARGESEIDHRVDIYALGVILYEMLTGHPPFQGDNYFQLLWKHTNEPPMAPSARCPECAIIAALDAVVLRALAKDPADRYATMRDLEEALVAAIGDAPPPAHLVSMPSLESLRPAAVSTTRPSGPLVARRSVAATLSLQLARGAAAGLGAWWFARDAAPDPVEPAAPVVVSDEPAEPAAPVVVSGEPAEPAAPVEPVEPASVVTVAVQFGSRPGGATVLLDGEELGVTPLARSIPAREAPAQFIFRKSGYHDEVVSAQPAEGARVEARLRPLRRAPSSEGVVPGIKRIL